MNFRTLATLCILILSNLAGAIEPPGDMDGALLVDRTSPFLGIWNNFGRWENGYVPIAYNHANAPDGTSIEEVESILIRSFEILQGIADLTFDYRGLTSADVFDDTDGIVVVAWDELEPGIAGRAGPDFGGDGLVRVDDILRLGYRPYLDGRVRFDYIDPDLDVRLAIHELMHLLGFGHSETPISIMNSSRHFFPLPQQDDIEALQALYGPPDLLITPENEIQLDTQDTSNISSLSSILFHGLPGSASFDEEDDSQYQFSKVDESLGAADRIRMVVNYRNAKVGDPIEVFVTDPLGNVEIRRPFILIYQNGWFRTTIETVDTLLLQPGVWNIAVGIAGKYLGEAEIVVEGLPPSWNARPQSNLSVVSDQSGKFFLNLNVTDAEEDSYTTTWHLPGLNQYNVSLVELEPDSDQPIQIFVETHEEIEREVDVPGGAGDGFAAIVSTYLATPAERDVPTFFVSQNLLHIPSINIEGHGYSLNFKLVEGVDPRLKFIESQSVDISGLSPIAIFDDLNLRISLPRLIINDSGALAEVNNLDFELDLESVPIALQLLGQ